MLRGVLMSSHQHGRRRLEGEGEEEEEINKFLSLPEEGRKEKERRRVYAASVIGSTPLLKSP